MSIALVVIDIQNDYFPGGKMELSGANEAGLMASRLLDSFRSKSLPVVHIQHISARPGAGFFLPGTLGADIHHSVAPQNGEPVFQKNFPNSFRNTLLLEYLKEHRIDSLVLAGMMTHMCIDTTVRAAFDLGFTCTLAHDACATRSLSFDGREIPAADVHSSFLAALNGLFAQVQPTETICANL